MSGVVGVVSVSLSPIGDPAPAHSDRRARRVDAPSEVFRASLFNGTDCKINARVNPLNVTDQLFRRTDITGASDAAVFAELARNVADGI